MARDPGTGTPPARKPRKTFLEAIGHPTITPGGERVISAPKGDMLAKARQDAPPTPHAPDPNILSRQRLLRASGFHIVVDGIWGPRSAAAWNEYNFVRAKPTEKPAAPKLPQPSPLSTEMREHVDQARHQAQVALQRTQAQVHLSAARRQLAKQLGLHATSPEVSRRIGNVGQHVTDITAPALLGAATEIRRAVAEAGIARGKAPEQMTTKQLVLTTVDPITGRFDPQDSAEVKRVQRWLASHGHKVSVDGNWGRETHDALLSTFKQYEEDERKKAVQTVVEQFYRPGIIKPGEPLGPLAKAPKPGELLAILHSRTGSPFTAAVLWKEIVRRQNLAQPAFLAFKEKQLDSIESDLRGAFGGSPDFIGRTIQTRVLDLSLDSATFLDPVSASHLADSLSALAGARSATQLTHRLTTLKAQFEAELAAHYKREQGNKHWWAKAWGATMEAAGVLAIPAEWTAESIETEIAHINDIVRNPSHFNNDHEYEQAVATARLWKQNHPWMDLGVQIAADPLWLVKPVELLGQGYRAGTLAAVRMERLGYAIEDGKLARFVSPALIAPAEHLARFEAAAKLTRESLATGKAFEGPVGRLTQLDHAFSVARKLTTRKTEMIGTVKNRIRVMRRGNFIDRSLDGSMEIAKLGKLRAALDESAAVFRSRIEDLAPDISRTLHESGSVIFSDVTRSIDSIVGGQIRGRLTASVHVNALVDAALDEGHYAYVAAKYGSQQLVDVLRENKLSGAVFDGLHTGRIVDKEGSGVLVELIAKYRTAIEQFGSEPVAVLEHDQAMHAGREMWAETMRRGTSHLVGGGDSWIAELLDWRMVGLQDDIGDVLAQVQERLEELNAAKIERLKEELAALSPEDAARRAALQEELDALTLYDDAGKFVGRGGETSNLALDVASEAFDATKLVDNAAYGVAHTADEMLALRKSEEARIIRDVDSTAARRAAEGIGMTDAARQAIIDERLAKVDQAWYHEPGVGHFDSRKQIERSTMYLRHLSSALRDSNVLSSLDGAPAAVRDILSVANVGGAPSRFETQLDTLSYFVSRSRSLSKWDLSFAKGQYDFIVRSIERDSELTLKGHDFRKALEEHTKNLDLAAAVSLPREMMKQWAVWEALSKAQTKPLQKLYWGLSASLDAWLLLTLPLRPGFLVRNVIDNTSKMLAAGAIDPRYYFLGGSVPGQLTRSIFDFGIEHMRYVLSLGGRFQNNPALFYFDRLAETFWQHSSDVLGRIFSAHQIDVPEAAIKAMQHDGPVTADSSIGRMRKKVWHLMAAVPENYAKRSLYRAVYTRELANGASEMEAFRAALDKIEFTLFDYSKVSVVEDNLRMIFPFIQYWRRTANFWVTTAVEKPALPLALGRYEDARDQAHADLPEWMRRYVKIDPVTNVLARVPGLEWLMPGLQDGLQTDPINMFSFGVLYRSFKQENPDLPPDKHGVRFLAPFADALNQWGVSFNPLVRKPLEVAGVFNFRAWQTVFPETGLLDALTRRFIADRVGAGGFNIEAWAEDKVLQLIGEGPFVQQRIADGFNQFVQLEIAAQAERGETPDRAKATQKIQNYYLTQTLLGFFGGMYARRRDASDVYLYKIAEQLHSDPKAFENLSAKDQRAYRLFKRRKIDALAFDRYLDSLPLQEAYYRLHGDWEKMQEFKRRHPEVIPYVSSAYRGQPFSDSFIKHAPLLADTETANALFELVDTVDVSPAVRGLAERSLIGPGLKAFWEQNDTPAQIQNRMVKGEFFRLMYTMNKHFFAIPESDLEARKGYLDANPLLSRWWEINNSHSDDLRAILDSTNATLRDRYFELLDAKDYSSARDFLHHFPFIFEFTKADDRVDANGNWTGHGGKSHPRSQHAVDYLAARASLNIFFALLKQGRESAYAWLNGSTDAAKIVRDYFKKYAHPRGTSAHAMDYLQAKKGLDHYFKLKQSGGKDAAYAWLRSSDPDAVLARAYFKKYGHLSKTARNWKKAGAFVRSGNPEINQRLQFWETYWTLTPDQRPAFIEANAEKDGVYVYGVFGQQEREAELQDYLRLAHQHHLTEKSAIYLRIKPLLDVYFTLKAPQDKDLFLRANPDVQDYLDRFSKGPSSGDKQLDHLIERYFSFGRHSSERAVMLMKHKELKAYFEKHSSPADRAIHGLLDVYFGFKDKRDRKRYSAAHPEIQAYFDKRRQERDLELAQTGAFDIADPRLQGLLDEAWVNTGQSAQRTAHQLRAQHAEHLAGDQIIVRR